MAAATGPDNATNAAPLAPRSATTPRLLTAATRHHFQKADIIIATLEGFIRDEQLELKPDIQRNQDGWVWPLELQRAWIVSLLERIPLSPLYWAETDNNTNPRYLSIDGTNRCGTIDDFLKNKFAVTFRGHTFNFSMMHSRDQEDFRQRSIPVTILEPSTTHAQCQFIFKQLQQGVRAETGELLNAMDTPLIALAKRMQTQYKSTLQQLRRGPDDKDRRNRHLLLCCLWMRLLHATHNHSMPLVQWAAQHTTPLDADTEQHIVAAFERFFSFLRVLYAVDQTPRIDAVLCTLFHVVCITPSVPAPGWNWVSEWAAHGVVRFLEDIRTHSPKEWQKTMGNINSYTSITKRARMLFDYCARNVRPPTDDGEESTDEEEQTAAEAAPRRASDSSPTPSVHWTERGGWLTKFEARCRALVEEEEHNDTKKRKRIIAPTHEGLPPPPAKRRALLDPVLVEEDATA